MMVRTKQTIAGIVLTVLGLGGVSTFAGEATANAAQGLDIHAGVEIDAADYIDRSKGDCGIQSAIDEAAKQGGGTILLPEGIFVLNRYLEMHNDCTLQGQGEKTVLTLGKAGGYARVTAQKKGAPATLILEGDLKTLRPGTWVTVLPFGENTHSAHQLHTRVKSVDGKMITVEDNVRKCALDRATLTWGLGTKLLEPVKPGARTICVENPEWLGPQQGLYFSGPGDVWNHHFNAVVTVKGNWVTLERDITISADAGTDVVLLHPAITGDHNPKTKAWLKNVTICNLVIDGRADELNLPRATFMQAGIHFNRTENLVIRNVTVRNWYTDGISVQGQKNLLVENCRAIGNHGRGLHPGTGVQGGRFSKCLSTKNSGDGLFYCFGNHAVVVRDCTLIENEGDGIGGLGYGAPSDTGNTVENNTIERNGKAGIACVGGGNTGNVVRNNIIRDNSQNDPGVHPGILIFAMKKGAEHLTVENNTIESTLAEPTQWVGIEERHSVKHPKKPKQGETATRALPTVVSLADNNRITGNRCIGHKTTDIIVRGPNTVAKNNSGGIVEKRQGLGPQSSPLAD